MSYEPTTWKDGDLVTSAKLNKLEQGVANGNILIVHSDGHVLDKTWQEIYDSQIAFLIKDDINPMGRQISYVEDISTEEGYRIRTFSLGTYEATNANGYPQVMTQ